MIKTRSRTSSRTRSRSRSRTRRSSRQIAVRIIVRTGSYFQVYGMGGSGCRRHKVSTYHVILPSGSVRKITMTDARKIGVNKFKRIPIRGVLKLNGKIQQYKISENKLTKL